MQTKLNYLGVSPSGVCLLPIRINQSRRTKNCKTLSPGHSSVVKGGGHKV